MGAAQLAARKIKVKLRKEVEIPILKQWSLNTRLWWKRESRQRDTWKVWVFRARCRAWHSGHGWWMWGKIEQTWAGPKSGQGPVRKGSWQGSQESSERRRWLHGPFRSRQRGRGVTNRRGWKPVLGLNKEEVTGDHGAAQSGAGGELAEGSRGPLGKCAQVL